MSVNKDSKVRTLAEHEHAWLMDLSKLARKSMDEKKEMNSGDIRIFGRKFVIRVI